MHAAVPDEIVQCLSIDLARPTGPSLDGLELGGDQQHTLVNAVVKRLFTEAVARKN